MVVLAEKLKELMGTDSRMSSAANTERGNRDGRLPQVPISGDGCMHGRY